MNLKLLRKTFTEESTIGVLSVNGTAECFTLEDKVRAVKIPGKTAIPAGIYEVTITFSDRFQKPLPLLLNVPNFAGIRIHPGNTAADTEGCILVGKTHGPTSSATVGRLSRPCSRSSKPASRKKRSSSRSLAGPRTTWRRLPVTAASPPIPLPAETRSQTFSATRG